MQRNLFMKQGVIIIYFLSLFLLFLFIIYCISPWYMENDANPQMI